MTKVEQLLSPPEPWADSAACAHPSVDPRWFWDHRLSDDAKRVCVGCPVADECLRFGMEQEFGIWGGYSANERKQIRNGENPGPILVEPTRTVQLPAPELPAGDLTRDERREWARTLRKDHRFSVRKIAETLRVGKTTVERYLRETAAA